MFKIDDNVIIQNRLDIHFTCGRIVNFEFDGKVAEVKCGVNRALVAIRDLELDTKPKRWRK